MDVSSVVMTVISVTIGVMLIGTLLIPQAVSLMDKLNSDTDKIGGHSDWANLLGVVVICSIIGLVAIALYAFKSKS